LQQLPPVTADSCLPFGVKDLSLHVGAFQQVWGAQAKLQLADAQRRQFRAARKATNILLRCSLRGEGKELDLWAQQISPSLHVNYR
jgi:hypothetical protein